MPIISSYFCSDIYHSKSTKHVNGFPLFYAEILIFVYKFHIYKHGHNLPMYVLLTVAHIKDGFMKNYNF